jgi:hypothetical protein
MCEGREERLTITILRSGFSEHNWSWRKSDGSTGSYKGDTLLITGPGTYYLQSLDTNGCYAHDTLIITPLKPVIERLRVENVDCYGNATGWFEHGNITGGSDGGFLVARWTIWDTANKVFVDSSIINRIGQPVVFRNQIAGNYVFYGLDADSCVVTETITIKEPDSLRLFPTPKKTTCLKENGLIAFEVTGGVVPYNISIVGPEPELTSKSPTNRTRDTIFSLKEGIYIAKVIDSNKCETGNISVEVLANPYPTLITDTIITAKCGLDDGANNIAGILYL